MAVKIPLIESEAAGETTGEGALQSEANDKGNVERVSTRAWAQSCNYDPEKLFTKLFHDDIKYLNMNNLWKKRRAPTPLEWNASSNRVAGCSKNDTNTGLRDQQPWSIAKCGLVFAESIKNLSTACRRKSDTDHLVWDSCVNIRVHIFSIAQKTQIVIQKNYSQIRRM